MKELLQFATELAERAGEITLKYYGRPLEVEAKADRSPVTIADREAEEFLRTEIEKRFPDDGILGEEFGEKPANSPRRWILDPIDGTKSFIRGVPLYGTLIALESEGEPVLGVARYPALDETLSALVGEGCLHNGKPCLVSRAHDLADSTLLTTDVDDYAREFGQPALMRFLNDSRLQRTWGDCYGYLLVATGRADAMIDPKVNWWDIAPMIPILREAGGRITDAQGNCGRAMTNAVAAGPALHEAVLEMIRA